jgi:hypothetical protein
MENSHLSRLMTDDFQVPILFAPSPLASHRMLEKAPEVARLRKAIEEAAVSETEIRNFVSGALKDLKKDERFPHEVVLAAIAVALESSGSAFADEYLRELANLNASEMSLGIRVARECLQRRMSLAKNGKPQPDSASPRHGTETLSSFPK